MSNRKVALIILDGYGIGEPNAGNAIYMAKTPVMDSLLQRWPHTKLSASGLDVGLPDGQMGNSEVGHTNIGSGRVVFQDLPRITNAISDGSFFENSVYGAALDNAANGKALHILGLLSDGGVHSHIQHIFAMVKMAHDRGIERVYLHCFLDGRDVAPTSGAGYVRQLRDYCAELGTGKIATLQGRFYGMDRDKRWDRIEASYNAMVCGEGVQDPDPIHAMEASYAAGLTDEFVKPVVCVPDGKICSGDSVIFMNFRPDRAREMTYALTQSDFDGFARKVVAQGLHYVCTTRYDEKLTDLPIAFPPEELHDTLGEIVSAHGLRQLRIAETEKYAHVTFFFNGGTETQYPGEDRVLIPSPREFPTYDLVPEMSAVKVKDELVARIRTGAYDMIVCNFANC
ncbi:MAG: 2,3-bisphosphoglycerate-independent phosphoglycerate mutase, partial [Oscillospiraceae bacterium]|nr:2,3-bisphosphoglycerate-independent phosphoglycerate mutase [Oscillospiraceae bacterium]